MKLKKDKYWSVRGSSSKILSISCASCGTEIFVYQKDGIGGLHRCYVNRILAPQSLVATLAEQEATGKVAPIACPKCNIIIATPHIHTDGRLAFNLLIGKYRKAISKR